MCWHVNVPVNALTWQVHVCRVYSATAADFRACAAKAHAEPLSEGTRYCRFVCRLGRACRGRWNGVHLGWLHTLVCVYPQVSCVHNQQHTCSRAWKHAPHSDVSAAAFPPPISERTGHGDGMRTCVHGSTSLVFSTNHGVQGTWLTHQRSRQSSHHRTRARPRTIPPRTSCVPCSHSHATHSQSRLHIDTLHHLFILLFLLREHNVPDFFICVIRLADSVCKHLSTARSRHIQLPPLPLWHQLIPDTRPENHELSHASSCAHLHTREQCLETDTKWRESTSSETI